MCSELSCHWQWAIQQRVRTAQGRCTDCAYGFAGDQCIDHAGACNGGGEVDSACDYTCDAARCTGDYCIILFYVAPPGHRTLASTASPVTPDPTIAPTLTLTLPTLAPSTSPPTVSPSGLGSRRRLDSASTVVGLLKLYVAKALWKRGFCFWRAQAPARGNGDG